MEKIKSRIIIEILGGPKEHVEKIMNVVVDKLKKEKDVEITSDKIFPIEEVDKLFTTFAEIELETEDINKLSNICFDYMPSSVEILEPAKLNFESLHMVDFLNDILARLHKSDMIVKNVNAQNIWLRKELEKLKK